MRTILLFLALVALLAGGFAPAQAGEEEAATAEGAAKTRPAGILERVKEALRLPQTAEESREAGVPEERVREVLEAARSRGVSAGETRWILDMENQKLRQGGNPENFGAAVHHLKESGLRGRELAVAIHAEQIARGMKKPKMEMDEKSKGKGAAKQREKQ